MNEHKREAERELKELHKGLNEFLTIFIGDTSDVFGRGGQFGSNCAKIDEDKTLDAKQRKTKKEKLWKSQYKKYGDLRRCIDKIYFRPSVEVSNNIIEELQACGKYLSEEQIKLIQNAYRISTKKKTEQVSRQAKEAYIETQKLLKKEFKKDRTVFVGRKEMRLSQVVDHIKSKSDTVASVENLYIKPQEYTLDSRMGIGRYLSEIEKRIEQGRMPRTKENAHFLANFRTIKESLILREKLTAANEQYKSVINALKQTNQTEYNKIDFSMIEKELSKIIKSNEKSIMKANKILAKANIDRVFVEVDELEKKETAERDARVDMQTYQNLAKELETTSDIDRKKQIENEMNALGSKLNLSELDRKSIQNDAKEAIKNQEINKKIEKEIREQQNQQERENERLSSMTLEDKIKEEYERYKRSYIQSNSGSPLGMESYEEFAKTKRGIAHEIEQEKVEKEYQETIANVEAQKNSTVYKNFLRYRASGGKGNFSDYIRGMSDDKSFQQEETFSEEMEGKLR